MSAKSLATLERSIVGVGGIPESDGDGSTTAGSSRNNTLRLAFLGCEVLPPYGPYDHTATLFCDLIAVSWSLTLASGQHGKLVLEVFAASRGQLPSKKADLFPFDGVVLPGSFSSAYETKPWILQLGDWIQNFLVKEEIPTLGVCFGHQLYAHSFRGDNGGSARKCPAGPQAGRKTTELTPCGKAFLDVGLFELQDNNNNAIDDNDRRVLDLFYTHGDMVESLPPRGVSLGGNGPVPIQSALYFSSAPLPMQDLGSLIRTNKRKRGNNADSPRVIAVTFQAHPEFAALYSEGESKGEKTFSKTVKLMNDNGDLSQEDHDFALSDAETSGKKVNQQSLQAMIAAGRLLGWFQ